MVNRKDFRPSNAFGREMSSKDRQMIQSSRKKVSNRDGVIKGFIRGESYKTSNDSLSTNGTQLKSYDTVIATRQKNGTVVVNNTKYSQTTTVQQNKLIQSLKDNHVRYEVTGGKDRGYEGEDFSEQIVDEKNASKEYSDLAKKNPEHEKKLREISREEKTHAKELEKLGGFESEKDKEKIMNKQLPTKHTKIEMGDYKTSPSGFETDIDGKRVVYVNNIKYEKHGNAKVYINSNGDALHYTDINKSESYMKNIDQQKYEEKKAYQKKEDEEDAKRERTYAQRYRRDKESDMRKNYKNYKY